MNEEGTQFKKVPNKLYHTLLAQRDIFFIAFDSEEQVLDSNYPVSSLTLATLDDLIFLVGPEKVSQIRAFFQAPDAPLQFTIANLDFELLHYAVGNGNGNGNGNDNGNGNGNGDAVGCVEDSNGAIFCLLIEANAQPSIPSKLSSIEKDYQIINDLTASLNVLSNSGDTAMTEDLQREILNTHLPEVERRLKELQDPSLKLCLEIIRSSMVNLINGEQAISNKLLSVLTPSEYQVAEFIRSGMSSQEIANTLNVAKKTVENHRNSLRNKLGITNRGVNLRNYLLSLEKN